VAKGRLCEVMYRTKILRLDVMLLQEAVGN